MQKIGLETSAHRRGHGPFGDDEGPVLVYSLVHPQQSIQEWINLLDETFPGRTFEYRVEDGTVVAFDMDRPKGARAIGMWDRLTDGGGGTPVSLWEEVRGS